MAKYVPPKRIQEIIAYQEAYTQRSKARGTKPLPPNCPRFGRFGDDSPETHERLSREELEASRNSNSAPAVPLHGLK